MMVSASSPSPGLPSTFSIDSLPIQRKRAPEAREAMAALLSLVRNTRFDLSRMSRNVGRKKLNEAYTLELGLQLMQVINECYEITPSQWDKMIDQLRH